MTQDKQGLSRREALSWIAGGVAATATATALASSATSDAANEPGVTTAPRMPVAFVPHGGGPWPFADLGVPKDELAQLSAYLQRLGALAPTPPRALLVISAHWEERVPTVMTAARPPMLFDYYGFPDETYRLSWPAAGAPELARRVQELLHQGGFDSASDAARGFDHGTFVPLMVAWPAAEVPTIQLSLKAGLDPAEHLAIGRALAPLRDEGVFIIGSGMTFHNLRAFFGRVAGGPEASETFDAWLREAATAEPATRDARLATWAQAPAARAAHPREEHLIPLMVIAGAAGTDRGALDYNGTYYGLRLSGYHFG